MIARAFAGGESSSPLVVHGGESQDRGRGRDAPCKAEHTDQLRRAQMGLSHVVEVNACNAAACENLGRPRLTDAAISH